MGAVEEDVAGGHGGMRVVRCCFEGLHGGNRRRVKSADETKLIREASDLTVVE